MFAWNAVSVSGTVVGPDPVGCVAHAELMFVVLCAVTSALSKANTITSSLAIWELLQQRMLTWRRFADPTLKAEC